MATKKSDIANLIRKRNKVSVSLEKDYTHLLKISDAKREKISKKISQLKQETLIKFWEESNCVIHWVPVDGGEIRVLHIKPKKPVSKRPIIFISGWQTMGHQLEDLYSMIHNRVEFYLVETRESNTSKIKRRKADFSIGQKAKDTQNVIDHLKLTDKDFILFGSCWGASIVFQGLIDRTLTAPTIFTFSPMYRVPVEKIYTKFLSRICPPFIFNIGLKIISKFYLKGEKAETQTNRMFVSIKESVAWKWRRTVLDNNKMFLFGKLSTIKEEVNVIGGTHDKIHNENTYPRFADEIPRGRFYYFGIDEAKREFTMGLIFLELSKTSHKKGLPKMFKDYEIRLD